MRRKNPSDRLISAYYGNKVKDMQTEILFAASIFLVGLFVLFITGAAERVFGNIYDRIGMKVAEYRALDGDFQISLKDCVHTEENGKYTYSLGMDITNNTTMTVRVKNTAVRDSKGRELEYITMGHTGPVHQFEINGETTLFWSIFVRGEIPKKKKEQVKMKVEFERVGLRTVKIEILSTLVSSEKMHTGELFWVPQ
jgi:hypothetical protein